MTNAERRWVFYFAVLVLLLTLLPYLIGFAVQGPDYRFTGFLIGVEDGNSYIAKMLAGSAGAWLFRTPYTPSPQQGVVMFLPYLLLGKLASSPGLHLQLVALYHLFRLAAGFLMIQASYDFLAFFVQDIRLRRFGLALVILGGGLGWVLVLIGKDWWLGSLPLDFYSPETFGFLGLFGVPHLTLARALLLWALLAYLRLWGGGNDLPAIKKQTKKIVIFWVLAGLVQPLATLVIGFVIALHLGGVLLWQALFDKPGLKPTRNIFGWIAVAGILPTFLLLYNVWAVATDPYLQAWTAQNIIRSPHQLHYLLDY